MGTTTEAAAEVRALFKKQGWSPRQIGVRADYFSLGSALRITLKDGSIPIHKVKEIAQGKEHIRRCEFSGEILGGGNRYVDIHMTDAAEEVKRRRYIEAVERAIVVLGPEPGNSLQPIIKGYYVGHGVNGYGFALWGESSHIQAFNTAGGLALGLAVEIEKGER